MKLSSVFVLLVATLSAHATPTPVLDTRGPSCTIGATYEKRFWENALMRFRTQFKATGTKPENACHFFFKQRLQGGALSNVQCYVKKYADGTTRYIVDWSTNSFSSHADKDTWSGFRDKAVERWQAAIRQHEKDKSGKPKQCAIDNHFKPDKKDRKKVSSKGLPGKKNPYTK